MIYGFVKSKNTTYKIKEPKILVGRDNECDIIITSNSVSAKHAEIEFITAKSDEMVCVLRDLNSTNGTFINDKRIESGKSFVVMETDSIRFGYDVSTWTIEVATPVAQKRKVSFEQIRKSVQKLREDETTTSTDEESDAIEYDTKPVKKFSPKLQKSPVREKSKKSVHDKLDILEERISSLEDSAVSMKKYPEAHLSLVQHSKVLYIQNISKELKRKVMKINFSFPSRSPKKEKVPSLLPEFDENSNLMDMLEDIKDNLEYVLRQIDFVDENTSILAEKLLNSSADMKSRQLEQYARSLELKLSELRTKNWEYEKQIDMLQRQLRMQQPSREEVSELMEENSDLEKRVKTLEVDLQRKKQYIKDLENRLVSEELTKSQYLQQKNRMLEEQNETLKKQLAESQAFHSQFKQSAQPDLTKEELSGIKRIQTPATKDSKLEETINYLSKMLVEKEKKLRELKENQQKMFSKNEELSKTPVIERTIPTADMSPFKLTH